MVRNINDKSLPNGLCTSIKELSTISEKLKYYIQLGT